MTKIAEKWFDQDGKLVIQEAHDFQRVLDRNQAMRSAQLDQFGGENKLVANVPKKMLHEWAKKWGVKMHDARAMADVIAKELNDSNNAHLRVWEGRY